MSRFRQIIPQVLRRSPLHQQAVPGHLPQQQDRRGLGDAQRRLHVLPDDPAVLSAQPDDLLHPGLSLAQTGGRPGRWGIFCLAAEIQVRQGDLEGMVGGLDSRLHRRAGVALVDTENAGSVGLDQPQAVENVGQVGVAQHRYAQADVLQPDAPGQAADGDELDSILKDTDEGGAAEGVVPVDQCVEQRLPHGLGRVVPDVHPIQAGELRPGAVESVDIAVGILQLLEQRESRSAPAGP